MEERTYKINAFTEQGVYMLATVLKGEVAVHQSLMIMRTFKKMRHYINENRQLLGSTDILNSLIQDNMVIKKMYNGHKKLKIEINRIKQNMVTKNDMKASMNKILNSFIHKEELKQFVLKDGFVRFICCIESIFYSKHLDLMISRHMCFFYAKIN